MAGMFPIGEIEAAGDRTTGSLIDRPVSQSQQAVDRRIRVQVKPAVAEAIGDSTIVKDAAAAAVTADIAGRNLLEASKGVVPAGANFDDLYLPEHIGSWMTAAGANYLNAPPLSGTAVLEISRGERTSTWSVTQRVYNGKTSYWRTSAQASTGVWGPWQRTATARFTPSEMILDLARRDEWRAVYDPGNTATLTENADGVLTGIDDGLGIWPTITGNNLGNRVVTGRMGQLAGFQGGSLAATLDGTLPQPVTYMMVVEIIPTGQQQYLIGSDVTPRHIIFLDEEQKLTIGDTNLGRETAAPAGIAVIEVTVDRGRSRARVNGAYSMTGTSLLQGAGISRIRIGARSVQEPRPWQGAIGPVLVYRGAIPADRRERMYSLLMRLSGAKVEAPPITPGARLFSMDSQGNPTLVQGDPDFVSPNGIQSTTKMINALVARKYLTTDALLDQKVTLLPEDMYSENDPLFNPGDVVSFRDLLYAAALPSSNTAPDAVARRVGELYLPAEEGKGGRTIFTDEMNRTIVSWGYEDASVSLPAGTAHLSPRQLADVVKRIGADPVLREIYGSGSRTVTVTGANARTFDILTTLWDSRWPLYQKVLGKTGSGSSRVHCGVMWVAPDGSEHVTVALDVPSSGNRWREIRVAQESDMSGSLHLDYSKSAKSGGTETSTFIRDITALFGAEVVSAGGGVFLRRTGLEVDLTFAGVKLTRKSWANILPGPFRPGMPFEYGSVSADGAARDASVSRAGTVALDVNEGETVRGTMRWKVAAYSAFPLPPFPGLFHSL